MQSINFESAGRIVASGLFVWVALVAALAILG